MALSSPLLDQLDTQLDALTQALLRDLYGAEADEILAMGDHISVLDDARAPRNTSSWERRCRP